MKKFVFALVVTAAVSSFASAGVFRRKAVCTSGSCQSETVAVEKKTVTTTTTTTAQGVANLIVFTGRFRHWGGNTFAAEGIGMGNSPESALANCCFYGRRQIADVGYARMGNGQWVAVARYR